MPPSERRKKITIQPSQICPLCREKVHREEVLTVCPGCRAVYHRECSGELASGRCTTLGCRYSQRRTASGRRPTAPVRPERPQRPKRAPLTASERTLRGAMACGVSVAFLFLAVHVAKSIEDNAIQEKRAKRLALRLDRVNSVLETYRRHTFKLKALARQGAPPASWRFPAGYFKIDDGAGQDLPDTAVISWSQLQDPSADSPLDQYFPKGFRHGLHFSTMRPAHRDFPRSLGTYVERGQSVHLVVAVQIESLERAKRISIPKKAGDRLDGFAPHSQAQIVLRAYLYDLNVEPSYKGCLEVSARSPENLSSAFTDPFTGIPFDVGPRQRLPEEDQLLAELRRNGLRPGSIPRADVAALAAAYRELARELRSGERR